MNGKIYFFPNGNGWKGKIDNGEEVCWTKNFISKGEAERYAKKINHEPIFVVD